MGLLKKADIAAPVIPQQKEYEVPELGGAVLIRPLLLSDRLAMAQEARANGRPKDWAHIATLLAYAVVDADGEPVFSTAQWEAFGAMHTDAALRLWDEAWAVSGLDSEAAAKNSQAVQSSGSP